MNESVGSTGFDAPPQGDGRELASNRLQRDLQGLLVLAVSRLQTPRAGAAAWALRENGAPYLAAANCNGSAPAEPDLAAFAAATALPHASDLASADVPEPLRAFARRGRYAAAVPVRSGDGPALAVLLLCRGAAAPRPRDLAALEAGAARLAGPLAGAFALARLGHFDAEARRLDRLAALGSLASEVAHELRNPLVSVKTFLQLLPERRDDPEFASRFFDLVNGELRRMERLLDLLIEHAAPAADPDDDAAAAPGAALQAVAALLQLSARKRCVALDARCESGLPDVALPEDALRQVLLNLVLNAIEASPEGATVQLVAQRAAKGVEIIVSDAGPGLPSGAQERIFEPFVSTRRDGPGGLGLAISRRLVEQARGAIRVAEREGGGAEFRVTLPAAQQAREEPTS